jgi:hypothetical protein
VSGEVLERVLPDGGVLTFENLGPGEWTTKAGQPAKTARRRYMLNGMELDSVSSIIDTLSKPALYAWYETQATLGAVRAERMGELHGVHETGWVERVRSLGLGASAKKDEGADRGNVTHAVLHALVLGEEPPSIDSFPAIARPWASGAYAAFMALDPKLIEAEQITCHPGLQYAGRPDLIARIGGDVTLVDYKSGKGRVFGEAHYQTRLYEMAKRQEGMRIDRILIVGINDDGGYELVECEASEDDALNLLYTFHSRKRINAGMALQRALARKLARAAA